MQDTANNPRECARALAKAITDTPAFIRYNELVAKACQNEETRKLYDKYLKTVERYQHAQLGHERAFTDEDIDRMNELSDKVRAIPGIAEAREAKSEFEFLTEQMVDLVKDVIIKSMYDTDVSGKANSL